MEKIQRVSTLFLLFVCCLLPAAFPAQANPEDSGYWMYTVRSGDNLWSLSKKHLSSMRYWKQLVELNRVEDPYNIPPGTLLKFPMAWLKKGATVATIVELQGAATIVERHTGRTLDAAKGRILWAEDVLRTQEGSNVTLQFADGSKILIQEGSEVKLEKLMSHGSTGMAETKIHLEKGRTHNNVIPARGPGSRFEISTPSAIAAVRGTEYRISADAGGESRAEVLRGGVGVHSVGVTKVVEGGFGTVSYSDKAPLEPVELLPAPEVDGLNEKVLRVPFPVRLEPVPGAGQYRLQVCGDASCTTLLFDKVYPTVNMWGPDLPDGVYTLRSQGIDKHGLEGKYRISTVEIAAHPVPPMQVRPVAEAILEEVRPAFQWTRPGEAARYIFQLATDESFGSPVVEEVVEQPAYTPVVDLDPGVYYWRVATIDSTGKQGPYSDPQQLRRTPPQPDMSDAAMDTEQLEFRWRKAEDDQSFKCQVARDASFADLLVDESVKEPRYSLKHLQPGEYFIRVAIVDADGYAGPFGAYQTVRVPSPPPHPLAFIIPAALMGLLML